MGSDSTRGGAGREPGQWDAPSVLHPPPAVAGHCPRDGERLAVSRIHLPGWRMAVEGTCPRCGHRYLQDLPSGHGLINPTTLDRDTGELLDPREATWFAPRLRDTFERPDDAPARFEAQRAAEGGSALLLNTLDPVYGHALLRLLAADRLARYAPPAASVVLVPRALAHLVPSGTTERWVVDEPFRRLGGWLLDLDEQLRAELRRFDEVRLVAAPVHPHPTTYDLGAFVGAVAPKRPGDPSIVLSLRPDRRWGRDAAVERECVEELVRVLGEAYEDLRVSAVGVGDAGGLPDEVDDLRRPVPAVDDERRWLGLLRGADLAIGVHGSNMLLPSALACATIELLPRSRYANALQATIVRESDPMIALDHHRMVYGDDDLDDVSGERVAEIAILLLDAIDRAEAYFTGPAAGIARDVADPVPRVWKPPPREPSLAARAQAQLKAVADLPGRVVARATRPTSAPPLERLVAALDALPAGDRERVVRADRPGDDPLAALAGLEPGAVSVAVVAAAGDDGRVPPPSRAIVERVEELGLRPHVFDQGRLVPGRPAGPLAKPMLIVGLAPRIARELRERASA